MGKAGIDAGELLRRIAAPEADAESFPRLLVVLAHPDDEVLALGGRLERLQRSRLLCVTDGAPENGSDARAHGFQTLAEYAAARQVELQAALRLAGLPESCARLMSVPAEDKSDRVGRRRIADQRAAFHLSAIAFEVAGAIEEFRPDAVLTHPYEGGHPDHDSCAFAVHTAVSLCNEKGALPVLEAAFYHARTASLKGGEGIETGRFLPWRAESPGDEPEAVVCTLTPSEEERKRQRLACFGSQRETLEQFGTAVECFRRAPRYDFSKPPHAGRLFFEGFDWGVTGVRFRELAAAARKTLSQSEGGASAARTER